MKAKVLYQKFAAQFAAASIDSLVESFNGQVGNRGWAIARSAHDTALIDEFQKRNIDIAAIFDGNTISFQHKVCYDDKLNKLVVQK